MNGQTNKYKIVAMIPARYASSRFPGKPLALLAGKPVIVRTCEAVHRTELFDEIYVVTDDTRIFEAVTGNGFKCIMSKKEHETGSDRIAEAVADIDCDIVVNVQGDEPFTSAEPLKKLLAPYYGPDADRIDLSTLCQELKEDKLINDPNYCKVVMDKEGFAMYFSRSPIPYPRHRSSSTKYYEHIGAYAFRKQSLLDFAGWEMLPNEASEAIECIRYLEYGKKIKVVETDYMGIEIDTPEDLVNAEKLYKERYGI